MFKKMSKWKGIILLSITMLSMQFAKAATWVDPATPPTGGNVQAPINTGSAAQTKDGAFYSNTGIMTNNGGSIISSGLIKTTASGYTGSTIGDIAGSRLCIGNSCINSWSAVGGGWNGSGSGTANYVTKWTGSTSIGNSIIYDNGSAIGIGTGSTINSNAKLDVYGNIRISGGSILTSASAFQFQNSTTLEYWPIKTSSIDANGYVGIGTASNSTYRLDVAGDIHTSTKVKADGNMSAADFYINSPSTRSLQKIGTAGGGRVCRSVTTAVNTVYNCNDGEYMTGITTATTSLTVTSFRCCTL